MTLRGKARGRLIELDEELPFPEGSSLSITVAPEEPGMRKGSPRLLLAIMKELPKLDPGIVDEFERGITESKLPVKDDPCLFS
jgi:hypothetical protein